MNRVERALADVRELLAAAYQYEMAGDHEYAAAHGAVAANTLARAIRWQEIDAVVVPIARAVA